jgi:hypothetical protein
VARSRWIYKADGTVINATDGTATRNGVAIMPDLPDFVSPIDGKLYSGRAGMREHCQRHNVTPVADLAGLPPKPTHWESEPSRREVEARKQQIAQIVNHYER